MSVIKAKQLEGVHANQLLDNLITAIVDPTVSQDISQGYKPSSIWVNTVSDKVFICSDNSLGAAIWIEIKESSGASLTVTQAAHGYSVSEVLRFNGATYVKAKADIQANVGIWLITKVIDANTFVISTNGYFTGLTGGTTDTTSYLSDTVAGGLTTTSPPLSQPIIYWTSATTGWVLGYPSSEQQFIPTGIMPIGSELFFENANPDTPTPSTEFVEANGQVISDALSPYNGKRIRNLNGATITGIAITALDDTLKTFTVSLLDVFALMVGDSLSPDVPVPNAVIKSVDYTTGVIEIGDFTLWSGGSFGLTTSSLVGATTFDTVGLKRFTRGNSSNLGGGGINTIQGHKISYFSLIVGSGVSGGVGSYNAGQNYNGYLYPDGINGTPREASETSPNFADGVWLKKIK